MKSDNLKDQIDNFFRDISDEDFKKLLEKANFEYLNKNGVNFVSPGELKN